MRFSAGAHLRQAEPNDPERDDSFPTVGITLFLYVL